MISDTDLPTFFQDPEFIRLNPSHTFPVNGASPPLIRAEANADTWLTTNWLASDAHTTAFLQGHDPEAVPVNPSFKGVVYPTSIFENRALDDSYLPRQGEYAVATHVFYGARPIDTSPLDPASIGFIGVVDLAAARRFDLPVAKILNAAGVAVAPDLQSIMAGYAAMKSGDGGTRVADPTSTDPKAYPLVKLDYAMLPADPPAALLGAIRNLFGWAVTDGQQALPEGALPLPKEQVDLATAAARGPRRAGDGAPHRAAADGRWLLRPVLHIRLRLVVVVVLGCRAVRRSDGGGGRRGGRQGRRDGPRAASGVGVGIGRQRGGTDHPPGARGPRARRRVVRRRPAGLVAYLDAPRSSRTGWPGGAGRFAVTVLEAPAPPAPTATLPAAAPRRRSAAVRRDRSDVDRFVTRVLAVVAASVAGFLVFVLVLSGLAHDRSQAGLVRRFRVELATQRAPIGGAIPSGVPVAQLDIPAIDVHEIVVQGTSSGITRVGPGHLAASVLPGQTGNAVIAGRRIGYGGPFSRLAGLRTGDVIVATTGQGRARYTVIGSGTSPSNRVRMMMPSGRNRLTLVTSDPPLLANRYRYVVARLDSKPFAPTGHASQVERIDLGLTGDPAVLATLFVWLLFAALVGVGAVEAFRRLPTACAWLVATPLVLAAAWLVFENFTVLLPATL